MNPLVMNPPTPSVALLGGEPQCGGAFGAGPAPLLERGRRTAGRRSAERPRHLLQPGWHGGRLHLQPLHLRSRRHDSDRKRHPFAIPAGTTTTLWAGVTFDNVGTTTGATNTELNNFGQGFNAVDVGSSTNTIFETTAAGSFFLTDNPAGAAVNFGGSPVANQGWELVVTVLPVELISFGVE
jgi:hypothetical protein